MARELVSGHSKNQTETVKTKKRSGVQRAQTLNPKLHSGPDLGPAWARVPEQHTQQSTSTDTHKCTLFVILVFQDGLPGAI